jgi:tRNA threonylcarbamoyladenosine modification (KEOPS) complex  Pcc1 subunit
MYHINFKITKDHEELYDCLQIEKINRDRSTLDIQKEPKQLSITITAKDATALRATFDGLIKLIITFEKMRDING